MKRTARVATCAAAALIAAALAGCSSSTKATSAAGSSPSANSSGGYGGATTATTPTGPSASVSSAIAKGQATVATKSAGKLGTILVDGKGRTLYLFLADKTKNVSTCTGACAVAWPPLLTTKGAAKPGKGADQKMLGVAKRSGGINQVSYNGHPLYYYSGDTSPGQTNGQGLKQFGALWYVVNAQGKQVTS
ncbi:COG4315 family predicted lipoprotein [Actinacidiphila sp. bgisy144]|uniref:COG4315 family predicted lipoprotein n=1 Tax=unclassified Actinacidiphila TaxID=2995708 RepID=UPI003EBEDF20